MMNKITVQQTQRLQVLVANIQRTTAHLVTKIGSYGWNESCIQFEQAQQEFHNYLAEITEKP